MTAKLLNSNEPIPGYMLVSRIGAGGYGEVWQVDAPGGLTKAIKFVYGQIEETRANSELKALERVKQVRHPFLLSLERFEIVDNQLLIVMELADASIHARFEECVDEGMQGIPRSELLRYLNDAADALDYMRERHGLQHLDVKPENLLLLAGHIKVADFGLVQGFQSQQVSLLGGLTPQYAPPEVFQGQPTGFSDQYSLAVLYVEMLTGHLPFDGVNAAQLTNQHLNESPDLSRLPEGDRDIIARALHKDPEQRYASCMDMIDALVNSSRRRAEDRDKSLSDASKNWMTSKKTPQVSGRESHKTAVIDTTGLPELAAREQEFIASKDVPEPTVTELPPVDLEGSTHAACPTLILGIGETAAMSLKHLRRYFSDRFGDVSRLPSIQTILIDTDPSTLHYAAHGNGRDSLSSREVIHLPLRKPQDYRETSKDLLRWINRRWIYNVPKSLMTEGLRPLGRLALVDCSSQTFQRIRQCLKTAVDPKSVEQTSARTNMSFDGKQVRVFIVGSTAGGTASGMAIDLGYAVQEILTRLGVQNATITALLTHSTARNASTNELAKVNTFAFLNELHHFCREENHYPGEPSSNISPAKPGQPPFHYTYLCHLGDNQTEKDVADASKQLAEYIGLDGFSSCGSFFNLGRKAPMDPARNLRTFSMHRISCASEPIIEAWTNRICARLANVWIGEDEDTGQRTTLNHRKSTQGKGKSKSDSKNEEQIKRLAASYAAKEQFSVEMLVKKSFEVLIAELRGDPEDFHDRVLADVLPDDVDDRDWETVSMLFQTINEVFGIQEVQRIDSTSYPELLERSLEAQIRRVTTKMVQDLRNWVLEQADQSGCRIAGALELTKCFEEHFSQLEKAAVHNSTKILGELQSFCADARVAYDLDAKQDNELTGLPLRSLTLRYYRLILNRVAIHSTMRMAAGMSSAISAVSEELFELRRELKQFAKCFRDVANEVQTEFEASAPNNEETPEFGSLWKYAVANLRNRQAELCIQLDRDVRRECLDEDYDGLFDLIMQRGDLQDRLRENMRQAARKCISKSLDGMDAISQMIKSSKTPNQLCLQIYRCFEKVEPKLLEHGGAKRLLLGLPLSAQGNQKVEVLKKVLGENVTLAFNSDNDVTFCCEVSGVPLASVAAGIIENRTDYADYADRLHLRTDVEWSTFLND